MLGILLTELREHLKYRFPQLHANAMRQFHQRRKQRLNQQLTIEHGHESHDDEDARQNPLIKAGDGCIGTPGALRGLKRRRLDEFNENDSVPFFNTNDTLNLWRGADRIISDQIMCHQQCEAFPAPRGQQLYDGRNLRNDGWITASFTGVRHINCDGNNRAFTDNRNERWLRNRYSANN